MAYSRNSQGFTFNWKYSHLDFRKQLLWPEKIYWVGYVTKTLHSNKADKFENLNIL